MPVTLDLAWADHVAGSPDGGWWVTPHRADGSELRAPYLMAAQVDPSAGRLPWPGPDAPWSVAGDLRSGRAVAEVAALFTAVERDKTAASLREYGEHLFQSLLGPCAAQLDAEVAVADTFVVAIRSGAGDGALHRRMWDAMHDGAEFLTRRANRTIVVVRVVPAAQPVGLRVVENVPRVLFAVGDSVTDPGLRAGAEVMGVLRGIERPGHAAALRVLNDASIIDLSDAVEEFQPDIVHLIGHGEWNPRLGTGTIVLRRAPGEVAEDPNTPAAISAALAKAPVALAIVSACRTADATVDAGLPLAATLVAGGVPLVIAMSGEVTDRGCRAFTRFLAGAIGRSKPLAAAMAAGRRAAHAGGAVVDSVDWAMPALFASEVPPDGYAVVDRTRTEPMLALLQALDLRREPLFAGRRSELAAFEQSLAGERALLLLTTARPPASGGDAPRPHRVGGTRLLRELEMLAISRGHLCLSTNFTPNAPPRRLGEVFEALLRHSFGYFKAANGRSTVQLADAFPNVTAVLGCADARAAMKQLREKVWESGDFELIDFIDAMHGDVIGIAAALQATGLVDPQRRPVLLLDDVHDYSDILQPALDEMSAQGLVGAQGGGFIVVLFGKESESDAPLDRLHKRVAGGGPYFATLQRLADLDADEQRLTYLTWLMYRIDANGHSLPSLAAASGSASERWLPMFRNLYTAQASGFWDALWFKSVCDTAVASDLLLDFDDASILELAEQ